MIGAVPPRPFRFAVIASRGDSAAEWRATARRAEELGYAVLLVVDHLGRQLSPLPALMAAADATTRLRVGSFVLSNDYRNPVMLAKELATIDLLSEGRLEVGIGAGWMASDYAKLGIAYDAPSVRVDRMIESARIIARLLAGEHVVHDGPHYRAKLTLDPLPVQRPRPPLLVGGGGPRVLSFAAREADIVAIAPQVDARGWPRARSFGASAIERRVARLRAAAGRRASALELNAIVFDAALTSARSTIGERIEARLKGGFAESLGKVLMRSWDAVETPFFLYGSRVELVARLRAQRERLGISYVALPRAAMEEFAPVVAELAGA